MTHVAVVGAGPSGVYTAEALTKLPDVAVDVIDWLPTPFGLVRYGVAPDHEKIKSIEHTLRRILEHPNIRFLGNVQVGVDVSAEELRQHYDAVVYTVGASQDRRLGVPGEDLPGSYSSVDVVSWYCGHPDAVLAQFSLAARQVVVIGVGNVAIDLARILAKPVDDLRTTDMPDEVMAALTASRVEDVYIVGRRGPAQTRFTTKELRELGELNDVDVVVDPREIELDAVSQATYDKDSTVRRNVDVLREWSTRPSSGASRRIHLRFLLRPATVLGTDSVSGVRFEQCAFDAEGQLRGSGEQIDIPAQMVLRAIGSRGAPIDGLPFDDASGTVPNVSGRIVRDGQAAYGEYVAGWIKRGATGVIGTNRSDANETVRSLCADLDEGRLPTPGATPDTLHELLSQRGVQVVTWDGWTSIDLAEIAQGKAQNRPRAKISDRSVLLDVARGAGQPR